MLPLPTLLYTISTYMSKKKNINFNIPLYLLAISNFAYAVKHGFSWLTIISIILTVIVLLIDIREVIHHGRK